MVANLSVLLRGQQTYVFPLLRLPRVTRQRRRSFDSCDACCSCCITGSGNGLLCGESLPPSSDSCCSSACSSSSPLYFFLRVARATTWSASRLPSPLQRAATTGRHASFRGLPTDRQTWTARLAHGEEYRLPRGVNLASSCTSLSPSSTPLFNERPPFAGRDTY